MSVLLFQCVCREKNINFLALFYGTLHFIRLSSQTLMHFATLWDVGIILFSVLRRKAVECWLFSSIPLFALMEHWGHVFFEVLFAEVAGGTRGVSGIHLSTQNTVSASQQWNNSAIEWAWRWGILWGILNILLFQQSKFILDPVDLKLMT